MSIRSDDETVVETCDVTVIDKKGVARVRKRQSKSHELLKVADLFKILGDPTRLKIIEALLIQELCVCDLAELLKISQSAISHQLRILRQAALVTYRREGKVCIYRLDDAHVKDLLLASFEHTKHSR